MSAKDHRPPRAAAWLLKHLLPEHIGPEGLGDYEELYRFKYVQQGRFRANVWFWAQLGVSLPAYFYEILTWSYAMFHNYFKVGARHLIRQKGYAFLNLSGLAVGMACCILIAAWVQDELSYDRHHEHADRIYRITYAEEIGGAYDHYALSPFIAAEVFHSELPEVQAYTRLWKRTGLVRYQGKKFDVDGIFYADPGFFRIFTHDFLQGDKATALTDPGSVVLTEDTAARIFGNEIPMGKTINLNADGDLKVTGVVRNPRPQSHMTFNYLISMSTVRERGAGLLNNWLLIAGWSYVLLSETADPVDTETKMAGIVNRHAGEAARKYGQKLHYFLQRVPDIHLHSRLGDEIQAQGDIRYVAVFSLIAIFILFIACINFMNLSTARSIKRAREVGMRKVFGAWRSHLASQFLAESVAFSLLGILGAWVLVWLLLPEFNRLTGKVMDLGSMFNGSMGLLILALIVFSGLIAGSYPAFILSSYAPMEVLHARLSRSSHRSTLRGVLVTLQFSISVALIMGTLIVLTQVQYMKNRRLGFNKEQILVVRIRGEGVREQFEAFHSRLRQNPGVLEASFSNGIPGRVENVLTVFKQGRPESDSHTFDVIRADYDFIKTYDIEMAAGRDFSREFASDRNGAFLINETAVARLDLGGEVLGKKIGFSQERMAPIVGVLKDFHYRSLKEPIGPLAVSLRASANYFLSIKLSTDHLEDTVARIKKIWEEFEKERSFLYYFVDDAFDALYHTEERLGRIITLFAVLAIFIACLGLFGLASYTAEQSTKEIGIRRVLGASVGSISARLLRSFLKWVLFANFIAWPLTYFGMQQFWLSQFSFKVPFRVTVFMIAGVGSLLIALLTVSYQSVKASLSNPADTLRVE
jgi:putative ABC transport system permease protein